jgi:hypothetical protein
VKDTRAKATAPLTGKGHAEEEPDDQSGAGWRDEAELGQSLDPAGALR